MPEQLSQTDHDLLIRIDERVRSSEEAEHRHSFEHQKTLSAIQNELKSKAEKSDVLNLQDDIKQLDVRVGELETAQTKETAQKQTIISVGLGGYKLWQILTGSIIFFITVGSVLVSIINSINP